jgi:prepilin-type N-terminal cleavage/methylation domain-containing protein
MTVVKRKGFTLAELLIALAILGVIATFTIPKVLTSTTAGKNRAIAKETLATISEAYMQLKVNAPAPINMTSQELAPYINYIKQDNNLQYQMVYGTENCNDGYKNCYLMPNGSILALWNAQFGGTNFNNATFFHIDPDGTGLEKGIEFILYYNGRILDGATMLNPTVNHYGSFGPQPADVPDWFTYN